MGIELKGASSSAGVLVGSVTLRGKIEERTKMGGRFCVGFYNGLEAMKLNTQW